MRKGARFGLILLLSAIGAAGPAVAGPIARPPLFAGTEPLDITLTLPLQTLLRERMKRPTVEAVLVVTGADGAPVTLDVEVKTRGHDRLANCRIPPLRIDFKRRQVEGTVFAGQNKLKLVNPCRPHSAYLRYLELEYLAYRVFAHVTQSAFRTRRVLMRYMDSEGNETSKTPAFFIEHVDHLAGRNGLSAVELPAVAPVDFDPRALTVMTVFQFVIGNTDWSATLPAEGQACCHNMEVLAPQGRLNGLVPVPFDFDQAGIVAATYAAPHEDLGLRSVRQRLYRGFCLGNPYIDEVIGDFLAARPAIERVLSEELSPAARAVASDYLDGSYKILRSDRQRQIFGRCRGG
ncbi:MAG: hypothetical protein ACN6I7_02665 [bacterium]